MLRLTPPAGATPLVTGIAAAAVLSGAAVFAVVHSGCDDPGAYLPHGGAIELIGGCLKPEDLPVIPQPALPPNPVNKAPALAP